VKVTCVVRIASVTALGAWGVVAAAAVAPDARTPLRYGFEPGLHRVYRQRFEREVRSLPGESPTRESVSRVEWTSHLLVVGGRDGHYAVGIQRNRTAAELLRFEERGRDRREQALPEFRAALQALGERFAEANRLTLDGQAEFPWSAARERDSEVLYGLHEVEPLPQGDVGPGDSWPGSFPLGLRFEAREWVEREGEPCLRIEGGRAKPELRSSLTFCPRAGAVVQARFEGSYPDLQSEVRERWEIELLQTTRGESLATWLADPELRLGALAALELAPDLPPDPAGVYALLDADDEAVRRQVLGLAYRRTLTPPPVDTLLRLVADESPRVRVLALRLLDPAQVAGVPAAVLRARDDADGFVRRAAARWLRTREAAAAGSDVAVAEPEGAGLPDWFCAEEPGWPERMKREVHYADQPAGFTPRRMTSAGFEGWLWLTYVPDDYRGDEPFPLLIYLSGGQGRAQLGLSLSRAAIASQGYLVLLPQADGYWWHERSSRMLEALLDEALRSFNVDTNRVYVAGFSNGGTGALHLATQWPHRFAAAVSLMGAGAFPPQGDPPALVNAAALPLLFVHGADDPQIQARYARETVRRLRRLAPADSIRFELLEDRGHELWLGEDDGLAFPFLERHVRDPFPRRLRFESRDLRYARHYWIRVVDKGRGPARVEAQFVDDATLRIETHDVRSLALLLRRELLPAEGPLRVLINGHQVYEGRPIPDCALLHRSLGLTADPYLAHSIELTFQVPR